MSSILYVDSIVTSNGTTRPPGMMPPGSYYAGKFIYEFSTTSIATSSNSFVDMITFTNHTNFTANSILEFYYHVPYRNDSSSWGGAYVEPNISFTNGVSWLSLGTTGYDGGIMTLQANTIHYQNNFIMIYPTQSAKYNVRIKFRHKNYDGTSTVNGSNNLNARATGTNLPGPGSMHYLHYTIKEWIPSA